MSAFAILFMMVPCVVKGSLEMEITILLSYFEGIWSNKVYCIKTI